MTSDFVPKVSKWPKSGPKPKPPNSPKWDLDITKRVCETVVSLR